MVFAFGAGLSIVVGLLCGAVPALQVSRVDPARALSGGSAPSAGVPACGRGACARRRRRCRGIRVVVRTAGGSAAVIPFLRAAVAAANPRATLGAVTTMEARLSNAVAWPRLHAFFVASLAGLALVLAAVGVYGSLSYTVAQREREIGIRMALGAGNARILALVLVQGAALAGAGVLLGVGAAAAGSRTLESFLYGVAAGDPLTFLLAPLVLVAAALAACWLPARRAARIDPLRMLRSE